MILNQVFCCYCYFYDISEGSKISLVYFFGLEEDSPLVFLADLAASRNALVATLFTSERISEYLPFLEFF